MTKQESSDGHGISVSDVQNAPSSFFSLNNYSKATQRYQVTLKSIFDKPENVAIIGVAGGAAGLGAVCMAGYLLKKKCDEVNKRRDG